MIRNLLLHYHISHDWCKINGVRNEWIINQTFIWTPSLITFFTRPCQMASYPFFSLLTVDTDFRDSIQQLEEACCWNLCFGVVRCVWGRSPKGRATGDDGWDDPAEERKGNVTTAVASFSDETTVVGLMLASQMYLPTSKALMCQYIYKFSRTTHPPLNMLF